jgi:hypothetical protein
MGRPHHRAVLGAWLVLGTGCTLLVENALPAENKPSADAGEPLPGDDAGSDPEPLDDGGVVINDAGKADSGAGGGDKTDAQVVSPPDGGGSAATADAYQIGLGNAHGCALAPSGKLTCWGDDAEGQRGLPDVAYKKLAVGTYHTCAITQAGALNCAGRNASGQRVSKPGPYTYVTAGDAHTCAITPVGSVECWGDGAEGQTTPPADTKFESISAGTAQTCGVALPNHNVVCFGRGRLGFNADVAGAQFAGVGVGVDRLCGIERDTGVVRCFGNIGSHEQFPSRATAISVRYRACAVFENGQASCWGDTDAALTPPSNVEAYQAVATGENAVCAIPATGPGRCESLTDSASAKIPPDYPK